MLGFHLPGNILSWDIFGYYLYLPFSFIYGDLALSNLSSVEEVLAVYQNTDTLYQLVPYEDNNLIKYPIGWALLNLPFFIVGHLIALFSPYPADGFSAPYQLSILVGSLVYLILGFIGLRRLLLQWFTPKVTAITLLVVALATNLLHQAVQAPGMVHVYLFALYAWVGLLVYRDRELGRPSLLLGVLTGVLVITRNSEIVFAIFLILVFGFRKKRDLTWFKGVYQHWNKFLLGALIGVIPQMIYWMYVTGLPLVYSYQNPGEGFDLLSPHTWNFLFSFRKGWLIYTPVMLFALFGLKHFRKIDRQWHLAFLWMLLFTVYLLSSWTTWWYAASFGQRSMVQYYAFLAIPMAVYIANALKNKKVYVFVIFAALTIWNLFQTYQYSKGVIHPTRMTAAAYWAHLVRTEPLNEEGEKLLLVNRSSNEFDMIPENPIYRNSYVQSFESDSAIKRDDWKGNLLKILYPEKPNKKEGLSRIMSRTGDYSFVTSSTHPFSPAIRLPYQSLTTNNHAWLYADVFLKTNSNQPVPVSLVVTFEHSGGAYKYRTIDIDLKKTDTWVELNKWYLTPEIRNVKDELAVYVWNRGEDSVWVDDLRIQVYDDSYSLQQD